MATREYTLGYTHGLSGRFPMHHRKGRPYISENARAGYLQGYRAGAEVARQREITRRAHETPTSEAKREATQTPATLS